jgi:hypothetical protein
VLTGSASDGTLLTGKTCGDWTSESSTETAQIGHSDGLGPNMNASPRTRRGTPRTLTAVATRPRRWAAQVYCFAAE